MNINDKLKAFNITLPPVAVPAAAYVPFVQTGNLVFLSGHIAKKDGKPWVGQLGKTMGTEEGQAAARAIDKPLLSSEVALEAIRDPGTDTVIVALPGRWCGAAGTQVAAVAPAAMPVPGSTAAVGAGAAAALRSTAARGLSSDLHAASASAQVEAITMRMARDDTSRVAVVTSRRRSPGRPRPAAGAQRRGTLAT